MSTKTITKRVALATVVALGAGVLSLVTVSSASAANGPASGYNGTAGGYSAAVTGSANSADAADMVLNIGVNSNVTSDVVITSGSNTGASVGLVNVSDITGAFPGYAGTTQTAVLLSNGKLLVYTATTKAGLITVTGGTISSPSGAQAFTGLSGDRTAAGIDGGTGIFQAAITPASGATSMTVRLYTKTAGAGVGAGLVNGTQTGTLKGQITVTIASSSVAGTVSVAKSGIYYASTNVDGGKISDATGGTWSTSAPAAQFANIRVLDGYGTPVTSTSGLLTATATNGAIVHLDDSAGVTGTQTSAFLTGVAADDNMLTVSAPTFAPLTTTVTISYNGTVVGTKTFTFTGPIAKVTLGAAALIALKTHSATAGVKGGTLTLADSAGNTIYVDGTYYPHSGFVADGASLAAVIASVDPVSGTTGRYDWSCSSVDATYALQLDYINTDGSVTKSNTVNASCAATAASFTTSFDKSTYTPGSIATLTVKLLDSKGNLAADDNAFAVGTDATNVTTTGGTWVSSNSTSTTSALGLITYQNIVSVTEGGYQAVVKFPLVQTSPSSVTAGYTVASGGTSLNDVLKGIVSLIASINKQIAALAKLVTKK